MEDKGPLKFLEANEICKPLAVLSDRMEIIKDNMIEKGFSAFCPGTRFIEHFCRTSEDLALHKIYTIERFKLDIARPFPMRFSKDEKELLFKSPFIEDLLKKRESENGCSFNELPYKYPKEIWRDHIDPAMIEVYKTRAMKRNLYDRLLHHTLMRQADIINLEAKRFYNDNVGFSDPEHRVRVFNIMAEEYFSRLGFEAYKSNKKTGANNFRKKIDKYWSFFIAQNYEYLLCFGRNEGNIKFDLELRRSKVYRSVKNAKNGDFIRFEFQSVIRQFSTAYRKFMNFNEMENILSAFCNLYEMTCTMIEDSVDRVIKKQ